MAAKKYENPVDALLPVISQAVTEWKQDHTPERIRRHVLNLLNSNSDAAIMALLGFETNYRQEWKVDHCNGRAGNSAAGEYIRTTRSQAIKEWLDSFAFPDLLKSQQDSIKKSIRDSYYEQLYRELRKIAEQKASNDAEAIFDQLTDATQLDNFRKTLALLEQTEQKEAA